MLGYFSEATGLVKCLLFWIYIIMALGATFYNWLCFCKFPLSLLPLSIYRKDGDDGSLTNLQLQAILRPSTSGGTIFPSLDKNVRSGESDCFTPVYKKDENLLLSFSIGCWIDLERGSLTLRIVRAGCHNSTLPWLFFFKFDTNVSGRSMMYRVEQLDTTINTLSTSRVWVDIRRGGW